MKKAYHFTVQISVTLENEEGYAEFPKALPQEVKDAVLYDINHVQEYADNTTIEHAYVADGIEIVKVRASLEN